MNRLALALSFALSPALPLALAAPASAEVARVQGGEHPDFTRIVVEAAEAGDWRFGRTDDGYALALSEAVTGYDLSVAFDKIPKDRVSGLWRDPQTGRLRLALSCACYAIAFEFRPGIVVIDIKSGPPPEGSAFEEPLDPPEDPVAEGTASDGPARPGYDWISLWREGGLSRPSATLVVPDGPAPGSLDPLRTALLEQISRGAAEGVVEIAERPALPDPSAARVVEGEGVRAGLGELPGIVIGDARAQGEGVAADGTACIPDPALAVADWRPEGPVAEALGPARSGMLTEFDAPVPEAIMRAARTYVSLGFGAEARQFLSLLPDGSDPGAALLRALAYVVDQDPLPANPLAGMESCDGRAALWAVLAAIASGTAKDLRSVNTDAMVLAFSGLPADLRRRFAPVLVDHALSQGDDGLARQIRDATLRAPGDPGPDVALMEAQYDLATGAEDRAKDHADAVLAEGGALTAEAAILAVEAALAGGHPVPPDLASDIAAYLPDARGTEVEAPLRRALALAHALAGDYPAAFLAAEDSPDAAADLWALAATGAGDDAFLAAAVPLAQEAAALADLPSGTREQAADRLLALGFAAEALAWLGPAEAKTGVATRVLAARAHLALRDARAALAVLSGWGEPEAERLRAEALIQLGDLAGAAEAYSRAGDEAASQRVQAWMRDWAALAAADPGASPETGAETGAETGGAVDPGPWPDAAALVRPAPGQGAGDAAPAPAQSGDTAAAADGPLARGAALVEDSARARSTIEALLLTAASAPGTP